MKRTIFRSFSMLLAILMLASLLPMTALAEGVEIPMPYNARELSSYAHGQRYINTWMVCDACYQVAYDKYEGEYDFDWQRSDQAEADAAADQGVRARLLQKAGEGPVSAAVGVNDLFFCDPPLPHVIKLEKLRMAEVLKNLSVVIGHCDAHGFFSFRFHMVSSLLIEPVMAAADLEDCSVHQTVRQLFPGAVVDRRHRGPGDPHPDGTLLLGQSALINDRNGPAKNASIPGSCR